MSAATELHCAPLYGTPRTPGRPTLGGRAAQIAERLGFPMMPHQRLIADVALELDPDTGYLAYDEVDIIINRQQGKSRLAFPMMTHRCLGFDDALAAWVKREFGHDVVLPGPQKVLYTAQRAEDARQRWRDDHVARLERSPFASRLDIRKRLAAEAIFWPNGSVWSPGSTTGKSAGTGDTIDMAFIDEAWSHKDSSTELGMRPAMLTRRWRQLWVMSMIPGLSRALPGTWPYLHQKRQNGRARVDAGIRRGTAYFEWGAPAGADPGDPATWWSCMPALGRTVPESAIRSDYEAMDLVDFCAEYLGWEPDAAMAQWSVISEPTWANLAVPRVRNAFVDPIALGIDAEPNLKTASIGMSAMTLQGDSYVELIDRNPGLNWVLDAVPRLVEEQSIAAIGVAVHGPAAPVIEPLRRVLDETGADCELVMMQGPAVSRACRQLYIETGEIGEDGDGTSRRVRHIGQDELDASVANVTKYVYGDEWRWQRSETSDPLFAVTLARYAGEAVEWVGGKYDISRTVG